jgi:hypothetical protein
VKRDPLKPANAERGEAEVVLQASKFSLYGSAATVEVAPPLRFAGDEGVPTISANPPRPGLAAASRATPLGRATLHVGTPKRPTPMLALRSAVITPTNGQGLAKRDDGQHARPFTGFVHRCHVISAIKGRCFRLDALADAGEKIVGKVASIRRAVATVQEIGRPVRVQTAALSLYP